MGVERSKEEDEQFCTQIYDGGPIPIPLDYVTGIGNGARDPHYARTLTILVSV